MSIALLKNVLFPAEKKRPQAPDPVVDAPCQIASTSAPSMSFTRSSREPHSGIVDPKS